MAKVFQEISASFNKGNSMVRKLIAVNLGVFILINLVKLFAYLYSGEAANAGLINHWIYMPADPMIFITRPWSLFTYMFVHEGIFHILFNMLWLYYLGALFQEYLGNKKVLRAYIYGGLAGGILYFIGMNSFAVLHRPESLLLGASAGVMAIIVGIATLLPDYEIRIFVFNIKLKYIAFFMVALSFLNINGENPGGNLAHIGGAITGYLYIRHLSKRTFLDRLEEWFVNAGTWLFKSSKKKSKVYKSYTSHMKVQNNIRPDQDEVDTILDKISKSGYESLTRGEREILFKASKNDS